MVVLKEEIENGLYSITLIKEEKLFKIVSMGNGDFYWVFYDKNEKDLNHRSGTFEITKENYEIYKIFDELYNDVKDSKIFGEESFDKERESYFKKVSNYNDLFHEGIITWVCDEIGHIDDTNLVNIHKNEESYTIEFLLNDKEYYGHSIRFRNSGSYYRPYNIIFNRMFDKLKDYEDEYRQIHIEEYLYEKNRILKR